MISQLITRLQRHLYEFKRKKQNPFHRASIHDLFSLSGVTVSWWSGGWNDCL